jgi:CheY-like chemotaxis protein
VLRALVVDDQTDVVELFCMMLERWGCACRTASTGNAALEIASEFEPELVLLDISLPDVSGYEVARALRALPGGGETYLAAVTGWGKDEDRIRAFAAGFDRHIVKPAPRSALRDIVDAAAHRFTRQRVPPPPR